MKHYLSACLMVKDEALYLHEWLKYHFQLGFDHVYLYDNESTDQTIEVAKLFGNKVTIERVFGTAKQYETYSKCMVFHGDETRWLAFIDTDEFVVPKKATLLDTLEPYEPYGGLCVHWVLFGDNGQQKAARQPVVERFTMREKGVNPHVKSFVDPKKCIKIHTSHKWIHTVPAVDENFMVIPETESRPTPATADIIQLNHYATKSREECYQRRVKKLRPDINATRNFDAFYAEHNKNEIEDLRALELWRKYAKS